MFAVSFNRCTPSGSNSVWHICLYFQMCVCICMFVRVVKLSVQATNASGAVVTPQNVFDSLSKQMVAAVQSGKFLKHPLPPSPPRTRKHRNAHTPMLPKNEKINSGFLNRIYNLNISRWNNASLGSFTHSLTGPPFLSSFPSLA